jgi:hypothetical protein
MNPEEITTPEHQNIKHFGGGGIDRKIILKQTSEIIILWTRFMWLQVESSFRLLQT